MRNYGTTASTHGLLSEYCFTQKCVSRVVQRKRQLAPSKVSGIFVISRQPILILCVYIVGGGIWEISDWFMIGETLPQ